ncbi:MAG: ABC transporter permease [Stigonema ocellatum SAG 48.90 = DSM 106950]|uniref:ABC transporter permease n=1 Tax=Spirosoma sp. TaxID=1899569 RepID=UPI0026088DB0|nr:ABC transporter permease [Spirosoma sp.]MBR8838082.1 ABC transporter permease [Stigonema ocellatum SAG 48.90 = DSM 106950]MCX6213905.1 ABC transporter permease [Spirosoma sp.]
MLQNYFTVAVRNLWSQRTYTLLNVLGLTVGLTGGLLIFLFLRYHLSTDRHQANFDRLVRFSTDLHLEDGTVEPSAGAPPPLAKALRASYPQVEQAAFMLNYPDMNVSFQRTAGAPLIRFIEHDGIVFVEPEWLDVLTYTWLTGNPKIALKAPNQVVLTESWAKRYFGTVTCLSKQITLQNNVVTTVVGVIADAPGPTDTPVQMLVSLPTAYAMGIDKRMADDWYVPNSTNRVYARLKDPSALAELQRAMPAFRKKYYGKSAHFFHFIIQPFADLHTDVLRDPAHTIRLPLLWSLGIIGLLLVVVACINFINLSTVQAFRRSKEIGIRKTLVSSRGQLIRQFLAETALVVGLATSLGLLLTLLLLPLFTDWVQLPLRLRFDGVTVGFVGLLAGGILLLAGGYPAIILSKFSPWAALTGSLKTTSGGGLTLRRVLVVAQFTVCQVLLLCALVVTRQTHYMQQADPGFTKDNIVIVDLPYNQKARHDAFKQKLLAYAGVQSVSLSVVPPVTPAMYGGQVKFNGRPDWEKFPIRDRLADADYLRTYGLHLLAGRNITPGDTIRDYVINETLMRKLGYHDPKQILGKPMLHYLSHVPLPIVGVVKDFYQKSMRDEISPCVIACWPEWYRKAGVRIGGHNMTQTLDQLEKSWQDVFPDEVFTYQFLNDEVANMYKTETLIVRLVNAFTILVILIGCLGLYSLVSYVVVQRRKEISIRKVLGASVSSVVALLAGDFLKLVFVAILLASPLAYYVMNRWLADFAYRIDLSWVIFMLAGLLAVGIALLTVSFQSIRAALIDPVKSLRSE